VECPKPKFNDLSRSLVALGQDNTIIGAIELSRSSWLLGGVVPGLRRDPRKKLPPDADALLGLLHRWRDEAVAAGRKIGRISLRTERRMRLFSQEGYVAVDFAARKLIMIGREGSVPRERGVPVPGPGSGGCRRLPGPSRTRWRPSTRRLRLRCWMGRRWWWMRPQGGGRWRRRWRWRQAWRSRAGARRRRG
jgi:hypothetical protein